MVDYNDDNWADEVDLRSLKIESAKVAQFFQAEVKFLQWLMKYELEPITDYLGSKDRAKVRCKFGHVFEIITQESHFNIGCRKCEGRARRTKNEIMEDLLKWASNNDYFIVSEFTGVLYSLTLVCPEGDVVFSKPANFLYSDQGACVTCGIKNNSLARIRQSEMRFLNWVKDNGFIVLGDFVNVDTPIEVRCQFGHPGFPHPDSILNAGQGACEVCSRENMARNKIEKSRYDFFQWCWENDYSILGEYIDMSTRVLMECPEGHQTGLIPTEIMRGKFGCSECFNKLDRVYLVVKDEWAKVGVASSRNRVIQHMRHGWRLYKQWIDLDNFSARSAEKHIKQFTSPLPNLDKLLMPQSGYTETFPIQYLECVENMLVFFLDENKCLEGAK